VAKQKIICANHFIPIAIGSGKKIISTAFKNKLIHEFMAKKLSTLAS
jgi:hypothetical protein